MSQSAEAKQNQLSFLPSDAALMNEIFRLPKVDLHRHVTGSLSARTAARIAAKHNIELPSYIGSELDEILFSKEQVFSHAEYFSPWPTLNRLFQSLSTVEDIIDAVGADAAADNVIYTELRIGPRGFLGDDGYSFQEYANQLVRALARTEQRYGVFLRCIVGIPRHVFIKVPHGARERMLAKIVYAVESFGEYFVGIDLNGDEMAASVREFRTMFEIANERGLAATVHAGELGGDADEVAFAVRELHARRIGHGLAAANSEPTLQLLSEHRCTLEICPTSNLFLNVVDNVKRLPLRELKRANVPFVICTDNPARCQTTLSEDLYRVARAFHLSIEDIRGVINLAIDASFASESIKSNLRTMSAS